MVVTSKPSWRRILRQVGTPLALIAAIGIVAAYINAIDHPFKAIAIPDLTISLLGAALGILLGFRTNSAYDRWWEARKLWGGLVNSSRSLSRQAISFIQAPSADRQDEAEATREASSIIRSRLCTACGSLCASRSHGTNSPVSWMRPRFQA